MKFSTTAFASIILSFCFSLTTGTTFAQVEPVTWSAILVQSSDSEYILKLTAETAENWVIYSQFLDEGGPIPTDFTITLPDGCQTVGKFEEPDNPMKKMDSMFDMVLTKFKGPATFSQKLSSKVALERITGTITFMTCDDSKCLPPKTVDFSAELE